MKQINNGFCSCYYLTEEGTIYNADTGKYKAANTTNNFILKTIEGNTKKISLKILYKLVYNKPYCIDNINNIDNEIWKAIEGTDNNYYISNMGRVKSYVNYEARILKTTPNKKGYERVDIVIQKQRYTKLIHRLVAAAFLPQPQGIDYRVHHKDFNIKNNKADNLEWLTLIEHTKKHNERKTANVKKSTEPKDNNSK